MGKFGAPRARSTTAYSGSSLIWGIEDGRWGVSYVSEQPARNPCQSWGPKKEGEGAVATLALSNNVKTWKWDSRTHWHAVQNTTRAIKPIYQCKGPLNPLNSRTSVSGPCNTRFRWPETSSRKGWASQSSGRRRRPRRSRAWPTAGQLSRYGWVAGFCVTFQITLGRRKITLRRKNHVIKVIDKKWSIPSFSYPNLFCPRQNLFGFENVERVTIRSSRKVIY